MERAQQQQARPRSKSAFSFKSDKSHNSASKHERKESYSENKPHLHPTTKADPNAAMNESQPIAAALEKPTLQSLRSFQHTDVHGNPIAEPDLSNPTRSRWERPLDTIRSFEAAIDNEYRRRAQTMRAESTVDGMNGYGSRRSSYYGGGGGGGGGGGYEQNRYSQASGYYGSRQATRESWTDNGHGMGGPVGGPPRARYSRMQSDPGWNRYNGSGYGNGHGSGYGSGYGNGYGNSHGNGSANGYSSGAGNAVYPSQGYHQSRDTVNTNGSNGSHSEPYSNDPSSDNSSFERAAPVKPPQPDLAEQYGFQGFGGGPIIEEYTSQNGYPPQQPNGASGYGAPPVPAKTVPPPPSNKPIKQTQSNGPGLANDSGPNVPQPQSTDKRKSWFKRRFSKD